MKLSLHDRLCMKSDLYERLSRQNTLVEWIVIIILIVTIILWLKKYILTWTAY
jgi:uncharacterized Rmd1/YagE family protein